MFKMSSRAICRVTLLKLKLSAILILCGPLQRMCVVGKTLCLYMLYSYLLLLVDLLLIADFSGFCPIRVGVSHVRYTVITVQHSQGWGAGAVLTASSELSESAYCWIPGLADMQSTVPVKVIGLQFYLYSLSPNTIPVVSRSVNKSGLVETNVMVVFQSMLCDCQFIKILHPQVPRVF